MKNRDNEFFREEELDELVEKRDYETLRDKMSRIFACPCCLNGFKHCRKYLEVFSKEEIRKTPGVGKNVKTPDGIGTVVESVPLRGTVKVKTGEEGNFTVKEYNREAVSVIPKNKS